MNKKSVVLFGDSGLGRFNRDRIRKLEEIAGNVDVYNCAVGGLNSRDALEKADFIAGLKADYVVFSLPGNDFNEIPMDETKQNLKKILEIFKDSKIIMVIYPEAEESFKEESDFNGKMDEYGRLIKKLSEHYDTKIVDCPKIFANIKDYHEDDGIHLNDYGYEVLSEEIARKIL